MKRNILITILITISTIGFSQDYIDKIALKACEFLNTVSDTIEPERLNLELGFCMIEAAKPYKKQLKRDYNIDFSKIDTYGKELGMIIGLKMTSVCPNALLIWISREKQKNDNKDSERIFEGQIISIDDKKFVEFSLKDEAGKISKFYWLTYIESNVELSNNYKTLLEESVRITFLTQEFFDARIAEYRTFNIIRKLEIKGE